MLTADPTEIGSPRVAPRPGPAVDVVVPVLDEEADLDPSVRRLHAYLCERFPFTWRITIADNASRDGTPLVAARLAAELPGVRVVRLEEKGRGRALRAVWSASDAAVLAYMDVDLSTDLDALLPLVAPLLSGHSDLAIGSRLAARRASSAGRSARSLARLQPAAPARVARAVHRRAVRVQGRPRRPARVLCRWCATRGGSSTPSCSCSPSAAGCGSTRCRSTGWTTRTAASTSSRPRLPTCGGSPGSVATSPPAGSPSPGCGPSAAPPRASFAGQALRFGLVGAVSTLAYLVLFQQ